MATQRYAVVIEQAGGNFSAYVPDLPGCVSTGRTLVEAERNMREAIQFHLDGLKKDGLPIPQSGVQIEESKAEDVQALPDDAQVKRPIMNRWLATVIAALAGIGTAILIVVAVFVVTGYFMVTDAMFNVALTLCLLVLLGIMVGRVVGRSVYRWLTISRK